MSKFASVCLFLLALILNGCTQTKLAPEDDPASSQFVAVQRPVVITPRGEQEVDGQIKYDVPLPIKQIAFLNKIEGKSPVIEGFIDENRMPVIVDNQGTAIVVKLEAINQPALLRVKIDGRWAPQFYFTIEEGKAMLSPRATP